MTEPETRPAAEGESAPVGDVEKGTYELIRSRLLAQAKELGTRTHALNENRLEIFGGSEMAMVGSVRIRTENNCVPRDVVQVGDLLLFGYNVFIGLRPQTSVADVLSAHRLEEEDGQFRFEKHKAPLLEHPRFVQDFEELYTYYKSTNLLQLRNRGERLLAVFQTGATAHDVKVLRWQLAPDGSAEYIDNRGERDHEFAPAHDFEWTETTREDHVAGRHPHVSLLGKVFVETVGGDLTVKVEDNTEDGLGIYREPVDDADQSLDDAAIHYAELGTLILIKVLPYREETWRYLVFNTNTQTVHRIDQIGLSCHQLPEDHGLVFPGGYYLRSGETKIFDTDTADLELVKRRRSPNGEDVLYVFHHRERGSYLLLPYNLIRKEVQNPIPCHGYSVFDSGRVVLFRATSDTPTRVHTMQIWETPFCSDEHAARDAGEASDSFLAQIGNAELVRGISDLLELQRAAQGDEPTTAGYTELASACVRVLDTYHWLDNEEIGEVAQPVEQLRQTAELILDEFEKVEEIRATARRELEAARQVYRELEASLQPDRWDEASKFVDALAALRAQRGKLISLRELRYMDLEPLEQLHEEVVARFEEISGLTVEFLADEQALAPYHERLGTIEQSIKDVTTVAESTPVHDEIRGVDEGLRLLSEVITGLDVDDATVRASMLERVTEVLAAVNRTRALLETHTRGLRSGEAAAEFGAEFKLFSQTSSSALSLASTPEECDEALGRQMLALEELEGRFSDFDEFLAQLVTKREEVYEAFSAKKQSLLDQRQRRAARLAEAAERILESTRRRASSISDNDELNAYFAADPMILKVLGLADELRELGDVVKADEIDGQVKAARQEASRSLRDRLEIFDDDDVIRLGRHRFSVNRQPFDLTLVPSGEEMALHLTGTDFHELVQDVAFEETRPFWDQPLLSETPELYRSEYLAGDIFEQAARGEGGLTRDVLHEAFEKDEIAELVRAAAAERYDEGYERGVHDHDAALILQQLVSLESTAGLLRFPPASRALGLLFWDQLAGDARAELQLRARSLVRLRQHLGPHRALDELTGEIARRLQSFSESERLTWPPSSSELGARYLIEEIAAERVAFVAGPRELELRRDFERYLRDHALERQLETDLRELDDFGERYRLALAWIGSFSELANTANTESGEASEPDATDHHGQAVELVAAELVFSNRLDRVESHARVAARIEGLLGQHTSIKGGVLDIELDDFLQRIERHRRVRVPGFAAFRAARHELLESERERLRLSEYEPQIMSSFVRNRLIDEVYLPLIGDNLAKQMGALGDAKRTDLMGLLLLISPPGYGKTTLMEYVASRLGLVFMKVNGPSLGHSVTSLDPEDAPNATARQEVDKINLALEMGNNVLLYLDDIQHTSSELLQKFISLCDAQRRIEGVWQGRTSTYDLRGKRFCVCMAGNPYTESGERFQIPDMLANRADVYNLGDVLEGKDDLFALSYLENSLTSNPVLSPLAARGPQDFRLLVEMAAARRAGTTAPPADQLEHPYSAAELGEILAVLERLLRVQEVLLKVNRAYIDSASQDDAYRVEPPFQLQGSYRNMNKLAERVVAVMNEAELEALIDDHYLGEAQTLTSGAEQNLLKLRELRGVLSEEESARWAEIKRGFLKLRAQGGSDDDPVTRVTGSLGLLSDQLAAISASVSKAGEQRGTSDADLAALVAEATRRHDEMSPAAAAASSDLGPYLERLQTVIESMASGVASPAAAPPPPPPAQAPTTVGLDQEHVALVTDALATLSATLATRLESISASMSQAVAAPATASGESVRVVQTLQPGVYGLLDDLATSVDRGLMDTVRDISRWLKRQEAGPDARLQQLLDRTLSQLDRFKDLLEALKSIDTGGLVRRETTPSDPD